MSEHVRRGARLEAARMPAGHAKFALTQSYVYATAIGKLAKN